MKTKSILANCDVRKVWRWIKVAGLLFAGLFCCGCPATMAGSGKIPVTIGICAADAKTIMPAATFDTTKLSNFVLNGTISGGSETTYGSWSTCSDMTGATLELEAGTYDFTLSASCGDAVYTGTINSKTISLGANSLSFTMAVITAGTGSVDFEASYTTGNLAAVTGYTVKAGLYNLDGTELSGYGLENITPTTDATTGYSYIPYSKSGIAAGTYFFKIRFYDGSTELPIYYDALCIIAGGLTSYPGGNNSSIELSVPAYHTITWNNSGCTLVNSSGSYPSYYSESQTVSLPEVYKAATASTVSEGITIYNGYNYVGWYTATASSTYLTELAAGTQNGDITLTPYFTTLAPGDIILSDGSAVTYANYDASSLASGVEAVAAIVNFKSDGRAIGVAFAAKSGQGLAWAISKGCEIHFSGLSSMDGSGNDAVISSADPDGWNEDGNYPAFEYCDSYSATGYTSGWFLGAKDELIAFAVEASTISASFTKVGKTFYPYYAWSSTDVDEGNAYGVLLNSSYPSARTIGKSAVTFTTDYLTDGNILAYPIHYFTPCTH